MYCSNNSSVNDIILWDAISAKNMNHSFIIVYNYEIKIIFVLYIWLLSVQYINRVFSATVTFAKLFNYSFIYLKYAVIMIVIELDSHI